MLWGCQQHGISQRAAFSLVCGISQYRLLIHELHGHLHLITPPFRRCGDADEPDLVGGGRSMEARSSS